MIAIYPEKLSSVSASSENAEYPASNLEDTKIKKVWKSSGGNTATLTATVGAGANNLALFGTNAVTAIVTIKIGAAVQETQNFALTSGSRTYQRLWCSYSTISVVHTVEITLAAASGDVVEAGVLKIGVGDDFKNPEYGLGEGRKDFSITKELNNGAFYIRKRNSVRTFSVNLQTPRETDFYAFGDLYDHYGPLAIAWLLAEDINDYQWAVLGHMTDPFSGTHSYPTESKISFNITEAV